MEYLKKAKKNPTTDSSATRAVVQDLLTQIKEGGENAARELSRRFDKWEGDILLGPGAIKELCDRVPQTVKDDIAFAHEQITAFARLQRESLKEFDATSSIGVRYGQRVVPMDVAGCYVPGGSHAFICSALMSVATAKVAGVPCVIACTPPRDSVVHPAVCYALHLAGADHIMIMGGVQAIASMAYGLFTGKPANILVGPGNAYVAEAKSILCSEGVCGIDLFAGPSEVCVIADSTADPMTVAIDLLSQAEHGVNSPAWLITDSRALGLTVMELMPKLIADLPGGHVPATSWEEYGEVVLCANREEMVRASDSYAPEHLEVQAADLPWWLKNLRSYGSLFLGEGSNVPHGDKCAGPNHILPTKGAAKYSGGLNVHKFLKILTYQESSLEVSKVISAVTSRLCRAEGMEGHARACDWRLQKHYPDAQWDFPVHTHPRHDQK